MKKVEIECILESEESHKKQEEIAARNAALVKARERKNPNLCAACGAKPEKRLMCAGCNKVCYCSKECQKKDWKAGHKALCKKIQAVVAAKAEAGAKTVVEGAKLD